MKRSGMIIRAVLAAILLFSLTGCAGKGTTGDAAFYLYYVNADGTGLYREAAEEHLSDSPEEVLAILSTPSEKRSYIAPVGTEYRLDQVSLNQGQLLLDFSEEYNAMDPILELLRRAAVVRTITQLPSVDTVSITVAGEPLTDQQGAPVGAMTGDQFITNAGREINAYEQTKLTLYFADDDGTKLRKVTRTVVYSSNIPTDKIVADELAKGIGEGENAYPIMDPSTKVVSTTVNDGICYVNLSEEFLNQPYSVTPDVTVYGIVNSLVELNGINKVQISVNGDSSLMYRETVNLSRAYERNLEIVEE
ncbi:MAG: GerMN domain-containing protein [Lachnospiraceae bacterium]|nr:GerMN domain-containing protein [Lachnospiraceae bacterium]